ncbi:MAG: tetratricopeptide repeat protein [Anaerolineae bacterium]|nr:tetratricopeptide repeat protein [Anaerolineae bacterium]
MTPIPAFPLIHLPPGGRNPSFTGREPMLARLDAQLGQAQGTVVVSQAITGLGGVGKTQLAVEYIYRQQADAQTAYDLVWWLRADKVWRRATPPDRYHATITTTWQMAFEQIQKTPGAVELLNLCCFLAPENIPLALFETSDFSKKSDVFTAADVSLSDPLVLADAVAALRRYSLVAREGDSLRLHRLVQTVARDRMGPELAQQWAEVAAELLRKTYRFDQYNMATWARCGELLPHVQTACELADELQVETDTVAFLNNETACYLQHYGNLVAARPYLERGLAIYEKVRGANHSYTATSLGNLGSLLQAMGDLAAARPYVQRTLAIREKALGLDHPDTATGLNNMGGLLRAMGDLAEARPYLERALVIYEKVRGADHPHTATSLTGLGALLRAMGKLAEARPYYERALAIREKALGPDHPDTATSLNNLGYLLQAIGDLAGARPYYQRALAIHEKALGPNHPDTATSLNNMGTLLDSMGDLAAARPYYERALSIREKVLGPDHPNTAQTLNNLGYLLQAMGDLAAAQPYYERALLINEKALGPDHPDTARSLNNLAILAYYEGNYAAAARLMRRALVICKQRLGPQHPDTISSHESLAVIESRLKP